MSSKKNSQQTSFFEVIEIDNHALCYITLVLNLLCFFVYLCSIGKNDLIRERQIIESVVEALPTIGAKATKGRNQRAIDAAAKDKETTAGIEELYRKLSMLPASELLQVKKHQSELAISILASQIFGDNDDQLKATAISQLSPVVALFERSQLRITIDGFTNEEAIVSTSASMSRIEREMARNSALYRYFVDSGISSERLVTRTYSGYPPGVEESARHLVSGPIVQIRISAPDVQMRTIQ